MQETILFSSWHVLPQFHVCTQTLNGFPSSLLRLLQMLLESAPLSHVRAAYSVRSAVSLQIPPLNPTEPHDMDEPQSAKTRTHGDLGHSSVLQL